MFCPKCGTENENSSQFCSSCGAQLAEGSSATPQQEIIIYAGFWRRAAASLIDLIVVMIGAAIIGVFTDHLENFVIALVAVWLYYALLESSSKQATLGKLAIGIVVTDLNVGRISFGRASGRYWGKIISAIILLIGFIMAGFTQKKQGLHDIMAETLVVKKIETVVAGNV